MQDYDCSKLFPSPVPRKTCSERIAELETALNRAAYVTKHLIDQVPEFTGVVVEGHREDDSIRESLYNEALEWEKLCQ